MSVFICVRNREINTMMSTSHYLIVIKGKKEEYIILFYSASIYLHRICIDRVYWNSDRDAGSDSGSGSGFGASIDGQH